jgi:integrase
MVIDLLFELNKKGLSRNSVRLIYATLRVILNNSVDDGLLPVNPALKAGKSLRQTAMPVITPLTRGELNLLLVTIKERFPGYYPLFLTLSRTGLRLGEALGLQWQDVDLDKRSIRVRRTLSAGRLESPKNGRTRNVDMSQQLTAVLREHLQSRKEELATRQWREFPSWVFCNTVGTPLDSNNVRQRIFYKAIKTAGIKKIRIHDLRHTYASLLIQNKESLVYARDQLGHFSIQQTVDTYGHLICGANREAVDRLDDES